MITQIELQNFKCFKDKTTFPLSNLNLLTGINGSGKSTLLQSLLLIRQSYEQNPFTNKIILNGNCLKLGTIDDLKNSKTLRDIEIVLSFKKLNEKHVFKLKENPSEPFIASLVNILIEENNTNVKSAIINIDLINYNAKNKFTQQLSSLLASYSRIHYIAADRIGPLKYHEKVNLGNFINVGSNGELTINVLAHLENELINDELYLGQDAQTLIQQTEEWLNYIFDGAKLDIKGKDRESSVYYLLLNTKTTKERYKPSNIGFGYTYILPIIVSGLIAKKEEILIVENPEAHLHPKAQSRIAEFLAKVASCGVQVFIESHSEHILNGIRIAALRDDINIKNTDTSILYFQDNPESPFLILELKDNGKIDNWVDGFFDQQEIDLAEIFKLGKTKK